MFKQSATKSESSDIASKMFALLDVDQDGELGDSDLQTLSSLLEHMFGKVEGSSTKSKELLKDVMDRDRDGCIDISDVKELALRFFCNFSSTNKQKTVLKENRESFFSHGNLEMT